MIPARLIAVAAALLMLVAAGCTRFDLLNATIPPFGYARTNGIRFGPLPEHKLDVYRPACPDPRHGVVVFLYGGDWQTGTRGDYAFAGIALANRGFVAVLPDYRKYPAVTFPAFVDDAALAVRWAHDHAADYSGDPNRLFLMGHSAGAHIAALLTLDAHYLAAVGLDRSAVRGTAGLSGPYAFVPPVDDRPAFNMARSDTHPNAAIEPIHFAAAPNAPPMLLVQGDDDTVVNPDNAPHLAAALRAAGNRVTVVRLPGRGHEGVVMALAWSFRWLDPVLDDATRFFHGL